MEKSGNVAIRTRLLRWAMNAILVLSAISFSGHVSQPKSFANEPTKTELKQTSSRVHERTVRFAHIHHSSSHSFFDQPENFFSSLFQYERRIEVELKGAFGNCTIDDKTFLIHFFNYNSEVSDTDASRG